MVIKCAVVCEAMDGPDIYFVKVSCAQEEYENGRHYDAAWHFVSSEQIVIGSYIVIDEFDPGSAVMQLFAWDAASVVIIGD
jgi:hypothetical protein